MEQIEAIAKKWGNSLGVILPSAIVEKEGIKEGKKIVLGIIAKQGASAGEIMEVGMRLGISNKLGKTNTNKILKDADRALWSDE